MSPEETKAEFIKLGFTEEDFSKQADEVDPNLLQEMITESKMPQTEVETDPKNLFLDEILKKYEKNVDDITEQTLSEDQIAEISYFIGLQSTVDETNKAKLLENIDCYLKKNLEPLPQIIAYKQQQEILHGDEQQSQMLCGNDKLNTDVNFLLIEKLHNSFDLNRFCQTPEQFRKS